PAEEGSGREPRDSFPSHAPLMTSTLNDLVLNNLTTSMAQYGGVRHVELLSTDPQDAIFLARVIRDRCPDVQMLMLGSELLYTDADYSAALRGTVVASSYPLYPPFQRWSAPGEFRTRLLFASQAAQGTYNATVVHFADAPEKTEDNQEREASRVAMRMIDY